MDDHDILFRVFEWAWVGLIAVIAWLIKKVYSVKSASDENDGLCGIKVAVMNGQHVALRNEFEKEASRNSEEHRVLMARLDAHNERVMKRLDSLLTIAKNGSK